MKSSLSNILIGYQCCHLYLCINGYKTVNIFNNITNLNILISEILR